MVADASRDLCGKWMEGMKAEASGNLEAAAETYTVCLQDLASEGTNAASCASCAVKHITLLKSWMSMLMRQENVLIPSSHQDIATCRDSGCRHASKTKEPLEDPLHVHG